MCLTPRDRKLKECRHLPFRAKNVLLSGNEWATLEVMSSRHCLSSSMVGTALGTDIWKEMDGWGH